MKSAQLTLGKRLLVTLEPGDEVLGALADACRSHGVRQALITTFSGAFRRVRLIASATAPSDPEAPMTDAVDVLYTEGIGSGTITTSPAGEVIVHVHIAVGDKSASGRAVAGHLLEGQTHYVVEVGIDEVLAPALGRAPHPGSSGVPILCFPDAAHTDATHTDPAHTDPESAQP